MIKRISSLLTALILVLCMSTAVIAQDVPDMERTGSISITMRYGQTVVDGGTLTAYRVGQIHESDGDYSFQIVDDLVGWEGSLEELHSAQLAGDLAQYVRENGLGGIQMQIGQDGSVVFTELELGLYLLVQDQAADGYSQVSPFLVSVPKMEDGVYVYQVDASPKVELVPEETTAPTDPVPSEPDDPTLPQTGQLNWPIPMLVVLGLALFIIGWALCFGQKKDRYEK